MALNPGSRLGPYEIESAIGAGGMGEVYRARDTRLDRAVAIKVLPSHLAADPERRARFEREARAVSSLNHPHIGALYDVGRENGVEYLVLELLDGETLAKRLERGPLASPQVIQYGVQIADALDRAHKSGIVHRDLKPGNIMITRVGVKLLDFGLARSVEAVAGPAGLTLSPTAGTPLTAEGTILGTFQYMAPEQLEGKEADARTDLFALGEILYEMATGKRAFEGKSQASLIAAILEREPAPISTLAPLTPPALERVVRACLAKDPEDRLQTAHDVKLQLQWIAEGGSSVAGVPAVVASKRKSRERLAWILAAAGGLATIAAVSALLLRHPPDTRPVRFEIDRPAGAAIMTWPRLSPDGRWVAFQVVDTSGVTRIWVRSMDALEARPLEGTEGALRPFWSPDGRFVAYFAEQKLKKTPVDGGPTQLIADATGSDGSWGAAGVILYDNTSTDSLMQVPASGGVPKAASSFNRKEGETGHAWPQFLPDGKHFLFVSFGSAGRDVRLKVGELGRLDSKLVRQTASRGEYAPPGRLIYVLGDNLVAQPFNLSNFKLSGEPVPVAENVNLLGGRENFSTSQVGTIAFQSGGSELGSQLYWIDRTGRRLGAPITSPDDYFDMAFSPDQQQVAISVNDQRANTSNLWIVDLARGTRSRLATGEGNQVWPAWSPDGQWIAYASDSRGHFQAVRRRVDGRGPAQVLGQASNDNNGPVAWSPDGRYVLNQILRSGNWDIDLIDLANGEKQTPLLHSTFIEAHPRISPDGKWIAYQTNENGPSEVFVSSFPDMGGKWQVSVHGGRAAKWSADGKELFFLSGDNRFMSATVETTPRFHTGEPRQLFLSQAPTAGIAQDRILPARDGKRFLANLRVVEDRPAPITVVVNWMSPHQ